jgi:glycosyltransferase involved in cell wall biosynthesis
MRVTLVRARAIDPAANKVAKTLSENGYDVKLLVWDRQHTLGTKEGDGYTIRKFNLRAPYDKFAVLFYLPIWWIHEFFFLLKDKSDVIHACDLDTLIPAIAAKFIKRVPLCYTIYDFYASNLPGGRFSQLRKLIKSLIASVERFGIRFADVLFLVDESRLEQVKGARIKELVYIYNSPPDYFAARGKPAAESIAGTPTITMFYAGVIHRSRGLEYVVKAVEELEDVRLVMAGTGPDKGIIEDARRRCERIHYLDQIPYTEVIEGTVAADILFALYDPAIPNNKHASPNKLFEAMMCGKPIIVSDGSSMANIVREENCGLIVPYGDAAAIKEAILKLRNDSQLRQALGRNGRRAYENRYNWQIMQQRLLDSYQQLGNKVRKKLERDKTHA